MAKGFLAGLKGIDAFGKVNRYLRLLVTRRHPVSYHLSTARPQKT